MRQIDLETWSRRLQYEKFRGWDYPHFSLCANIDLTVFYPWVKRRCVSFNIAVIYVVSRAANEIPEFRYRIRGDQVVEHEIIHPSTTILMADEQFTFCTIEFTTDFAEFAERAERRIAEVCENPSLSDGPGQDDLLFMTSIPWVSFTSMMHPIDLSPVDSFPRVAWGKYFQEGVALKMPLSVQAHHALMDGIHAGKFYIRVQALLDRPGEFLG